MKSFGENRLLKSFKLLSLSIKSINPIQKYPHMIESYVCILNIFVSMFLLPINILISFRIFSTPKLSKWVRLLCNAYKVIQ